MDGILVPVDGSDSASEALQFALENHPDARIHVLHVLQVTEFPDKNAANALELAEGKGEEILRDAREMAVESGRDVETAMVRGEAAKGIVSYAEQGEIDMIVMGSVGRTGIRRFLLGSVAETVSRRASVPVTIVR